MEKISFYEDEMEKNSFYDESYIRDEMKEEFAFHTEFEKIELKNEKEKIIERFKKLSKKEIIKFIEEHLYYDEDFLRNNWEINCYHMTTEYINKKEV